MPSSFFAFVAPWKASWLKPLSFRPPWSVARPTFRAGPAAAVVAAALVSLAAGAAADDDVLLSFDAPQAAATVAVATASSIASTRLLFRVSSSGYGPLGPSHPSMPAAPVQGGRDGESIPCAVTPRDRPREPHNPFRRRATQSISMRQPDRISATPTVVRAGARPGSRNVP